MQIGLKIVSVVVLWVVFVACLWMFAVFVHRFCRRLQFLSDLRVPEGIEPVRGFDAARYMGRWYEIARLDHSFQRNMNQVTADYRLGADGIQVINRGYDTVKRKWKVAVGKASFVGPGGFPGKGPEDVGHLKVSFFGPFYGSYVVFYLDEQNYDYALVTGADRSYLWILARTPQLDQETTTRLIAKAQSLGFDVSKLIFNRIDSNGK